jgi:hypothetical protein
VSRQQAHLRRRRYMQHMYALAGGFGEPQQFAGGDQRSLFVAPLGMTCRVALAPQRGALA